GAPESLAPLPQVERVRITSPDDQSVEFRSGSAPITYAATNVPGLYRVQQIVPGGQQTIEDDLFAANLADRDESDIRPRLMCLSGQVTVDACLTLRQKECWGLLAALALPLLMFEWFWFHRRV